MKPYHITTREEYQYAISRGFNPLLCNKYFTLDIDLRIEIQSELFGHSRNGRRDIPQANETFYRWVWEHKPHICEETMRPLGSYAAIHISHILSRGARPEMAHDPRNVNILCIGAHEQWETGNRRIMRIYGKNLKIIELLKREYETDRN